MMSYEYDHYYNARDVKPTSNKKVCCRGSYVEQRGESTVQVWQCDCGTGSPINCYNHPDFDTHYLEPAHSNTLTDQINRACREPTLLDALAYIALWESERVIPRAKIALENNTTWDTCFHYVMKQVIKQYKLPPAISEIIIQGL